MLPAAVPLFFSYHFLSSSPNEIIFTLDTFLARVVLFITNAGIRGYVTKLSKGHVARPVKYLDIEEPISDYRELRRVNLVGFQYKSRV